MILEKSISIYKIQNTFKLCIIYYYLLLYYQIYNYIFDTYQIYYPTLYIFIYYIHVLSNPILLQYDSNPLTTLFSFLAWLIKVLKSSASWLTSGKKRRIVLGLVSSGVNLFRNIAQTSPCL